MAGQVVDYLSGFLTALPDAPLADLSVPHELLADPDLRRPPPEDGRALGELLAVVDRAARPGLNPASPGYFAFIPGSGLVSAGLADLVADVLNRYTGMAAPAPGLVALETDVLRWLADVVGLPTSAGGLLTSGGSIATLSALITARHARLGEDFLAGTLYATDQVHHAVVKAARLAGFPTGAVRIVPTDAGLHMDVGALAAAVAADRAAGRVPFCVVGSAGTTNTGTVDPLPQIADLCAREDLWFHVDGAYGGAFALTERGARRLRGMERADSVVLDPHKSLFLPFGTGALLVRDVAALRAAHSGDQDEAGYLHDLDELELPDFAALGPELTRDTRGLRLWLPLHLHGVAAFRAALDEKLDLAAAAYALLRDVDALTLLGPPELSTIAFHCSGPGTPEEVDARTAELLRRVNAEGRVFLASTRVRGRRLGRLCVLNHRTDRARLDEAVSALTRHAKALAAP
ncbi:aminotransferase class V-fold PLP-dependent enzyme [Pseudonocardia sp. S2-4]|uniref:Aminotransferase class V-fold PLP-dependent enzyme n=2 Tax=Pseudonocardia humida TaxID=2800819 RepID=A0ABT0ZUT9_9PSEU|nr:aminotransferase class V-fold PLP-dependent enzyme [Pseudonocardia humida]